MVRLIKAAYYMFSGWKRVWTRLPLVQCVTVVLVVLSTNVVEACEMQEYYFDIPRQDVTAAINEIATQVDALLLFPYDEVKAVETNPVNGKYTVAGALRVLLLKTGLSGRFTCGGVITIFPDESTNSQQGSTQVAAKRSNIMRNVVTAVISVFGASNAVAQETADGSNELARDTRVLEEIVVNHPGFSGGFLP